MSDDARVLAGTDAEAARELTRRRLAGGSARALAEAVLEALDPERSWEREVALERLRTFASLEPLLDPLLAALCDQGAPERRNAARSALAALGATDAPTAPATLARLAELLRPESEADDRILAATALGESGNPEAIPPLEAGLRDPEPNVAAAAADALGVLALPAAVEALGAAAREGDFWVRVAAVVSLGRIGEASAIAPLEAVLADRALAAAAAEALGAIGDPRALPMLERAADTGGAAREAALSAAERILVARPGSEAPEWFLRALRGSEEPLARRLAADDPAAAEMLALLGTRAAAEHLVDALEPPTTAAAAAALPHLPAELAREVLLPRLPRLSPEARPAALAALPPLASRVEIDAVARYLADEHEPTRAAAVEALCRSDTETVFPIALRALEVAASRHAAAQLLGRMGRLGCGPLADLLDDEDPEVRHAAGRGLVRCATEDVRGRVVAALGREREPRVRYVLAEALGASGGPDAVRQLVPLLDDPDPALRYTVLRALGRTGASEAVAPLVEALEDGTADLQAAALLALGSLGDPSAAESVAGYLDAAEGDLRITAAFALRDVATPRIRDYLVGALDDRAWAVRHAAARTLASIGATDAIDRLRRVAREDPDSLVRRGAQASIEQLERGAPDAGGGE